MRSIAWQFPACAGPGTVRAIGAPRTPSAALTGQHPALAHDAVFPLAACTLYGGFAGSFLARALRLGRMALRQQLPAGATPA